MHIVRVTIRSDPKIGTAEEKVIAFNQCLKPLFSSQKRSNLYHLILNQKRPFFLGTWSEKFCSGRVL